MPFTRPLSRDEGIYAPGSGRSCRTAATMSVGLSIDPIRLNAVRQPGQELQPQVRLGCIFYKRGRNSIPQSAKGVNAIGATTGDSLRARVLHPKDVKQP